MRKSSIDERRWKNLEQKIAPSLSPNQKTHHFTGPISNENCRMDKEDKLNLIISFNGNKPLVCALVISNTHSITSNYVIAHKISTSTFTVILICFFFSSLYLSKFKYSDFFSFASDKSFFFVKFVCILLWPV